MRLNNTTPATFFSRDNNVLIRDVENNMFYQHPNERNCITFNLPVGVFYTDNELLEQPDFIPYEKFKSVDFKFNPKEFSITVKQNPNKATINTFFKTIVVDPSILEFNYAPLLTFLLGHEMAHLIVGGNTYDKNSVLLFDAEKACDDISRNYMLSHGFNPSQIKIASELLLRSRDRKECIHNNTIGKYNLR